MMNEIELVRYKIFEDVKNTCDIHLRLYLDSEAIHRADMKINGGIFNGIYAAFMVMNDGTHWQCSQYH